VRRLYAILNEEARAGPVEAVATTNKAHNTAIQGAERKVIIDISESF